MFALPISTDCPQSASRGRVVTIRENPSDWALVSQSFLLKLASCPLSKRSTWSEEIGNLAGELSGKLKKSPGVSR